MAKFYTIIAIIAIIMSFVDAEPPRFRQTKRFDQLRTQNNRKLFARQEVGSNTTPLPAPYAPAGVTPEIPFDLPSETEAPVGEPDQTYGPPEQTPDQTYGPPEQTPDQTYGPPEPTPDQTYGPPEADNVPNITEPDNIYGSPTADSQTNIKEPEAEEFMLSEVNEVSENLIRPRTNNIRSRSKLASLRSRLPSKRSRSAALRQRIVSMQPRFNTVEIIHSEPVLVYTLH